MKKIVQFAALAMMCSYASGIGVEWGVGALDFGTVATPALANTTTYGNDLGDYILKLVYVGSGAVDGAGKYTTLSVVDTGTLMTVPVVVDGVVTGSATLTTPGTYVMLLYNNFGGYYSLSTSPTSQINASPASFVVVGDESPVGFFSYGVSGNAYKGALVPEPSTAALAIAGIAMLFRRKRT